MTYDTYYIYPIGDEQTCTKPHVCCRCDRLIRKGETEVKVKTSGSQIRYSHAGTNDCRRTSKA